MLPAPLLMLASLVTLMIIALRLRIAALLASALMLSIFLPTVIVIALITRR